MSLQLPPERDLPDPDAMFQRILADQGQQDRESLDHRRRRVWLVPAAAAAVVLVVGIGFLFRNTEGTNTAPPPGAAPSVSSPQNVTSDGQTKPADQAPTTAIIGAGTATIGDVKLTVKKGADTRASIAAEIEACSTSTDVQILNLGQWSLEGSNSEPIGLAQLELRANQCKAWRVEFVSSVRPATFVFTDDDEKVSWTFS